MLMEPYVSGGVSTWRFRYSLVMSSAACLIEGEVRVMRARPAKEDGGEDNVSNIPNIDVNTLSIIILFECGVLCLFVVHLTE